MKYIQSLADFGTLVKRVSASKTSTFRYVPNHQKLVFVNKDIMIMCTYAREVHDELPDDLEVGEQDEVFVDTQGVAKQTVKRSPNRPSFMTSSDEYVRKVIPPYYYIPYHALKALIEVCKYVRIENSTDILQSTMINEEGRVVLIPVNEQIYVICRLCCRSAADNLDVKFTL